MSMKRFIASFVSLAALVLPLTASAASFVISPSGGAYHVGDTVTLSISVNPAGSTIYTAMMDARVSPAYFDIVSFSLNDALLPLKQSGYDALDSAQGILTKTGGFTGGITSTSMFGTVVLRAKAVGTGTFSVVDSAKLLDGNNADQQSGTQTASFSIAARPVASAATPNAPKPSAVATPSRIPTKEPVVQNEATPVAPVASVAEQPQVAAASSSQLATAAGSSSSVLMWVSAIVALMLTFFAGYFVGTRRTV